MRETEFNERDTISEEPERTHGQRLWYDLPAEEGI